MTETKKSQAAWGKYSDLSEYAGRFGTRAQGLCKTPQDVDDLLKLMQESEQFTGSAAAFRSYQRMISRSMQESGRRVPLGLGRAQHYKGAIGSGSALTSSRKGRGTEEVPDYRTEFLLQLGGCENIKDVVWLIRQYNKILPELIQSAKAAKIETKVCGSSPADVGSSLNLPSKTDYCTLESLFLGTDPSDCLRDRATSRPSRAQRKAQGLKGFPPAYTPEEVGEFAKQRLCKGGMDAGTLGKFLAFAKALKKAQQEMPTSIEQQRQSRIKTW